ncbi:hypothetical protein MNSC_08420 [Minisyncoccus archaeophilus]
MKEYYRLISFIKTMLKKKGGLLVVLVMVNFCKMAYFIIFCSVLYFIFIFC